MPPALATLLCTIGVLWIFRLDREEERVSPALWLPVAWLSLGASRSVSEWLAGPTILKSPDQYLDGSPIDQVVYTGLLIGGLLVLISRVERVGAFLRANAPLVIFFLYCLASVMWSEYPFVAFKRWTKAVGNLVMVLVVLSEADPAAALRRLLARSGFVLLPLSVLLIKYYPEMGRHYSMWTGMGYNSGVAISKNGLGFVCLVFGLASAWRFLRAVQSEDRHRARRPMIAHGIVLATTVWLFWKADAAASLGCFLVGTAVLALTNWRRMSLPPTVIHALAIGIVALCVLGLFIDSDVSLAQTMGRDATLTGRTDLWEDVLEVRIDPWVGTGFESFWLGDRAKTLWKKHWWRPNQAHNGYLETYLNLGWIGVGLLGLVIAWGYRNVVGALRTDEDLGGLRLAFFVAALLQNLTEATFKVMHPVWIVFLLAVAVVPEASAERAIATPARAPARPRRPLSLPATAAARRTGSTGA